ncbi:MAG TPA: DNA methyltransferase [Acidimicrobiales bacterium]|nr:DNA methyltransferase [Acidimicrobiales bacterium]
MKFPLQVLTKASSGEWVLDPFCGRGTTLYAARLLGLPSVGIDTNPIAVALAAAKLVSTTPDAVVRRCKQLLDNGFQPSEVPEGGFWDRCFSPTTLRQICTLREQLVTASSTPITVMLRALLLGILHGPVRIKAPTYLSNQMPRSYASKPQSAIRYWEANQMAPPSVDVLDVLDRRARYALAELPPDSRGEVRCGNSITVTAKVRHRFSWVITSPPYYGMRTYVPDQWLRAWFLGGEPVVDYGVRGQLSHSSEEVFVEELARVWRASATRCLPGATLVVRFGALPSRARDPANLLSRSILASKARWVIDDIVPAGVPSRGRRQADQMNNGAGKYVEEVDLYASLQ